jgi:hypothetical protein
VDAEVRRPTQQADAWRRLWTRAARSHVIRGAPDGCASLVASSLFALRYGLSRTLDQAAAANFLPESLKPNKQPTGHQSAQSETDSPGARRKW